MTPGPGWGALPLELLAVGETMAMVAPRDGDPFGDSEHFRVDAGGAESNVAAHVAALGHRAGWFSRLGDDPLGHRIAGQLRSRGVDVSSVLFDSGRPTGLYVKFPGSGVQYYRAGSAASTLSHEDAEVLVLDDVRVLHVSGITAALSTAAAGFLERIMQRARQAKVLVSFDVNHRPALWDAAAAAHVLDPLLRQSDIAFVGRDEAEGLWGTATTEDVRARFESVPELIVKDGAVGATAYRGNQTVFERSLPVDVIDVVGAGDAFAGGYLAALISGDGLSGRLRAGHRRAALTLQTTGDSIDERAM